LSERLLNRTNFMSQSGPLINGNPVRFTGSAEKIDQFGFQGSGNIRAAQGLIC
jgi:hypothetical protein